MRELRDAEIRESFREAGADEILELRRRAAPGNSGASGDQAVAGVVAQEAQVRAGVRHGVASRQDLGTQIGPYRLGRDLPGQDRYDAARQHRGETRCVDVRIGLRGEEGGTGPHPPGRSSQNPEIAFLRDAFDDRPLQDANPLRFAGLGETARERQGIDVAAGGIEHAAEPTLAAEEFATLLRVEEFGWRTEAAPGLDTSRAQLDPSR